MLAQMCLAEAMTSGEKGVKNSASPKQKLKLHCQLETGKGTDVDSNGLGSGHQLHPPLKGRLVLGSAGRDHRWGKIPQRCQVSDHT